MKLPVNLLCFGSIKVSEKVTGREPEEEDGCARSLEAKLVEEGGGAPDRGPTHYGLPAKAPYQGNLACPIKSS